VGVWPRGLARRREAHRGPKVLDDNTGRIRLVGLDACKHNGWVVAQSDADFTEIRFQIATDLKPLFDQARTGDVIAVLDVPIGLSHPPRSCDVAARKLLGPGTASVCRPPCREALQAATHHDADEINRRHAGVGLSIMAFSIAPRIRAVDALIRRELQRNVREGHPEVSFAALNGNRPLQHRKNSKEGLAERMTLLKAAGVPAFDPVAERTRMRVYRELSVDDVVDAAVMLVTARHVALGNAQCLPMEVEQRDPRGLLMQIWAPPEGNATAHRDPGTHQRSVRRAPEQRKPERLRSHRPGVSVAILITKGARVLLLKRRGSHGAGTWSPPGGYLALGERPDECAARNAKEEAGVEVTDVQFLAITSDVFANGQHDITMWMHGTVAGQPAAAADGEVAEVSWFTWDALPAPQFLPFLHLLEGSSYPALNLRKRWRASGDNSRV
jgi:predicted RNase H-like nuclease/ADP-ribose pyrophosphatase YjhB (NUDIX family)